MLIDAQLNDGIHFLAEHGLNLFAVFDCATLPQPIYNAFATDGIPLEPYSRLVLFGNGGGHLWEALKSSTMGRGIDSADPVDDFSQKLTEHFICHYLPAAQTHIFYPGPSSVSLMQLGALANWSHPSPLGLGIHPHYGLWFAYRAAFLTTAVLPLQRKELSARPCDSCVEKPCVTACPAGATSDSQPFDVQICYDHRLQSGSDCASQCLARAACPVGAEYVYSNQQTAHHYELSLSMAKRYLQTQQSPQKNIVLTGFMGTGKTTVGKLLAAELGYQFVDTDELIEARLDRTIPQIFAELGEAAFRQTEAEIAVEVAQKSGVIVSTGGGLMLNPQNAVALGDTGHVFCLAATAEEIVARVLADEAGAERPLLASPNPEARVVDLLTERAEAYGQFAQIPTTGRTPDDVMLAILDAIDKS